MMCGCGNYKVENYRFANKPRFGQSICTGYECSAGYKASESGYQ